LDGVAVEVLGDLACVLSGFGFIAEAEVIARGAVGGEVFGGGIEGAAGLVFGGFAEEVLAEA
jgi:hypothetical protein